MQPTLCQCIFVDFTGYLKYKISLFKILFSLKESTGKRYYEYNDLPT
jgi:hypothetical protein